MAWRLGNKNTDQSTDTDLGFLAKILTPEGESAGVGETVALIVEVRVCVSHIGVPWLSELLQLRSFLLADTCLKLVVHVRST